MKILPSILAIFLMLISCDKIKEANEVNEGTLTAFIECVESLENEYVKSETIKNACIEKHEKPIRNELLLSDVFDVKGVFRINEIHGFLEIETWTTNFSESFIVTKFSIEVTYYDKYGSGDIFYYVEEDDCFLNYTPDRSKPECQNKKYIVNFDNLWSEPGNQEFDLRKVVDYDLKPSPQSTIASMYKLIEVYGIEIQ